MKLRDEIVILARGKKIAILGPTAVGKTTLHEYLRSGAPPNSASYRPTLALQRVDRARPELTEDDENAVIVRSARVPIRAGRDVPGDSDSNVDAWRRVVERSNVVLYMFDGRHILTGNETAVRRVMSDCEFIGQVLAKRTEWRRQRLSVVLVATKLDLAPRWRLVRFRRVRLAYFQKRISQNDAVKDARLALACDGMPSPGLVVGSMVDGTEDFAYRIFEQVEAQRY